MNDEERRGPEGAAGARGAEGAAGARGTHGDEGSRGTGGEKGERGRVGARGATGERGEKGETGQVLYTRSRFYYTLLVLAFLSTGAAIGALGLSLATFSTRLDSIQQSRVDSAVDTCRTLRAVILQAYKPATTPQKPIPAVLSKRHTTVTLISSDGRRQTFQATSTASKVTITIIHPKSPGRNAAGLEQIRAGPADELRDARAETDGAYQTALAPPSVALACWGMNPTKNLSLIQAAALAALTSVVTCVVAFVPSFGPEQKPIIGALGALLSLGFLIANALHASAASRVIAASQATSVVDQASASVSGQELQAIAVQNNELEAENAQLRSQLTAVQSALGSTGQNVPPVITSNPSG